MKKKEPELKPCPFCGKKAAMIETEPGTPCARWSVRCSNDMCRVWTVETGDFDKKEWAIAAWNRRAK